MSSDPFEDFDAHFDSMRKAIERTRKAMLPARIVSAIIGLSLLGFVCWAIYRLVIHFAG